MNKSGFNKGIKRYYKNMFQQNMLVIFSLVLLFSPFVNVLDGLVLKVSAENEKDIIEISDAQSLAGINKDLNGSYILNSDINVSEFVDWEPIGQTDNPFTGDFFGNGFKITKMNSKYEGDNYSGLFGHVSNNAQIKKLNVELTEESDINQASSAESTTDDQKIEDPENSEPEKVTEEIEEGIDTDVEDAVLSAEGIEKAEDEPFVIQSFGNFQPLNQPDFAGGDGSIGDPYLIETAEQLDKVRDHLTKHFKLNANINLNVNPHNQNEGWEPLGISGGSFQGSFNGNGYTISNLMIDRDDTDQVGLFGVSSGSINNVTLIDVSVKGKNYVGSLVGHSYSNITNSNISGNIEGTENTGGLVGYQVGTIVNSSSAGQVEGVDTVGGLVGRLASGSSITNSHSSSNVTGTNNYIGGLIGYHDGTLNQSSASGNIIGDKDTGGLVGTSYSNSNITESFATGEVRGKVTGGLVGRLYTNGKVINSYASSTVEGEEESGGLVGRDQSGEITNSYSIGQVMNTPTSRGGLIGVAGNTLVINDSFYDLETSGQSDDIGKGTPKLTTEMQTITTFTNWDFDDVWDLPVGDYPRLQWEGIGSQPPIVSGDIIYVKEGGAGAENGTSWDNAFATLQEALDVAPANGKQIWIAKGTYYPTKDTTGNDNSVNPRIKTFRLKNNIAMYGGFSGNEHEHYNLSSRNFDLNETILSGDIGIPNDDSDNVYHVIFSSSNDNTAVLSGVTVTGGNADNSGPSSSDRGGGLYIPNNSNPSLTDVIIRENKSSSHGGGIHNGSGASPVLKNVKIINNSSELGGGMASIYNSNPVLTDVEIYGNKASGNGGGVYNSHNSSPTMTRVKIIENIATSNGGGIYSFGSDFELMNVEISRNTALSGGGGVDSGAGNLVFTNVLINDNTAVAGGGMSNFSNNKATLINVTITGNNASYAGSGIKNHRSSLIIKNSIIWGNQNDNINNEDSAQIIMHSLVGGSGGSGANWDDDFGVDSGNNIDKDPKFVMGSYELAGDSPAIDMGDDNVLPQVASEDLLGNDRIFGGSVDMGAYENQSLRVISVTNPPDEDVDFGTVIENIALPDTVEVTLSNGTKVDIEVDWDTTSYDGNTTGDYTLFGELKNLPNDAVNPNDITAKIVIKVKQNPAEPGDDPADPGKPGDDPADPADPAGPGKPGDDPVDPVDPAHPTGPIFPVKPGEDPTDPVDPTDPAIPADSTTPTQSTDIELDETDESKLKKDSSDSLEITVENNSNQLPKTATSNYTIMWLGLLMIILGSIAGIIIRRKNRTP